MNIDEAIQRASGSREKALKVVEGTYRDDPRTMMLLAYTSVIDEHHRAIVALLQQELYGSSFTLVRSVFEVFMRAHWVAACATDVEVGRIATKEFDFPGMATITEAVDQRLGAGAFFSTIKRAGWDAMNSYAHGGLRQLSRRFKGGRVEPNYAAEEILEVIDSTTVMVLLLCRFLAKFTDQQRSADSVEKLLNDYTGVE